MSSKRSWRDLFVRRIREKRVSVPSSIRVATKARLPVWAAATQPERAIGAFINTQTLLSFAGASAAISIIARVLLALWPGLVEMYVMAIVALVIGIIILIINVTDGEAKPQTSRDWFVAMAVGIINCFYLVAVAIGVFELLSGVEGL